MTSEAINKPIRRTYVVADVKCYLCGTISGTVESEQQATHDHRVMFRTVGAQQAVPILDWRQLRCDRCGGPVFLDEQDIVTRRFEEYNWLDERPRRGRPPKRLVEQRRREREMLESQAA